MHDHKEVLGQIVFVKEVNGEDSKDTRRRQRFKSRRHRRRPTRALPLHARLQHHRRAQRRRARPGSRAPPARLPFVIQKHAASHLHYDFRLGWNGVLKSWAVAKGPSYYTGDRRLAVQVEDHPMEYGGFEGIIPQGQYGGGTVMVWDQGTWTPQPGYENVDAGLRDGSLKFVMNGTKMKGKWTLVRMGGKAANEKQTQLAAHQGTRRLSSAAKTTPAITEEAPNSAVTGRTMEQIAEQEDHVWNSKETARGKIGIARNQAQRHRMHPKPNHPSPSMPHEAKNQKTRRQLRQES